MRICQRAGIMVRMVTGDNVETAKVTHMSHHREERRPWLTTA